MRFAATIVILFCCAGSSFGQPHTDKFLDSLFKNDQDSIFQLVVHDPIGFRLQIIYTRIDRDRHNHPHFNNFYFNVDPDFYFNPASTVKLPLAVLALEKLQKMHIAGVTTSTAMQFDSSYEKQVPLYRDSSAAGGFPSVGQFIRKAFLVSDNDAYNRLYQFVGPREINQNLHRKGYNDVRITRQFMNFTPDENRHTNQIRFINIDSTLIYLQKPGRNTDSFHFTAPILLGKGHWDQNDSLINAPIDFTMANNISLSDLQQILQTVIFPMSVGSKQRFDLSRADHLFLRQYLSQYPSETNYPKYDTSKFYDSNVKFFFKYGSRQMPQGVRDFNKVGWAYGFLTDVSYVADFDHKLEYMLSATLYVNSDGILNDNKYDYDSIGWPFMYRLGQIIYHYELQRHRDFVPDLSPLKIKYDRRNSLDDRPTIREVDN